MSGWFSVPLTWVVLLCLCGYTLSSGETAGSDANKLFIGTAFPRNISHIFKGSWQFINESNPKNVGFEKQEGAIWFSLRNVEFSGDVDMVQGEAVIRDGIYSTDENMKFLLQGAYFFHQGTLLLLAHPTNPYVEEIVPAANFSLLTNMSVTQAFEAAEKIIIEETSHYNGTTPNLCPFRFVLQMRPEKPVSLAELAKGPQLMQKEAPIGNSTVGGSLVSSLCNVVMSISAESVQLSVYVSLKKRLSKWRESASCV